MFARKQVRDRSQQHGDIFPNDCVRKNDDGSHVKITPPSDPLRKENVLYSPVQDISNRKPSEPSSVRRRSWWKGKSEGKTDKSKFFKKSLGMKLNTRKAKSDKRTHDKNETTSNIQVSESSSSSESENDNEKTSVTRKTSFSSDESSILDLQSVSDSDAEDQHEIENSLDSELEGIKRLERKLEIRRQRLQKLCAGRRSSYIQLLEANDEAASQITLALYKEQHRIYDEQKEESNDSNNGIPLSQRQKGHPISPRTSITSEKSSNLSKNPPLFVRLWWTMLFEVNLTLPAFFTVIVVLLVHTTFYSVLDAVLREIYYVFFESYWTQYQYYLTEIALGLCLIRINGNVFYWLSSKDYSLVQLEMQNRFKIGTWDAKFLKRIKGTIFSSALSMFGYYLASVGVYNFFYQGQLNVLKPFEDWYATVYYAAGGTVDTATGQDIKPPCEDFLDVISSSDDVTKWLLNYFCNDTTQEWRLIVLLYGTLCFAVSALIAAKLGHNFLTFCD